MSRAKGITCPACKSVERDVIESRRLSGQVRRRCICKNCGARYTTYECQVITFDPVVNHKIAKLLDKFQDLEQAFASMRQTLDEEFNTNHLINMPATPNHQEMHHEP